MNDNRKNWVEKAVKGEITLNGLELLMSQRHKLYEQQLRSQRR